ncbi:hypothetical protein [Chitinophaga sp. CF418]|uniref:hypothetical protein n=1 Tax=Chitinophaga sp. CF418 TaxID=1855287 RepID=UPI000921C113|nr:hypothetical protein [Chitinophaga sp. CF418]SHN28833.1 hypothetical protein SAMN05216311_108137 [Chitinophaga sp. CF418]
MPNLSNNQPFQGNHTALPICKTRIQWEMIVIHLFGVLLILVIALLQFIEPNGLPVLKVALPIAGVLGILVIPSIYHYFHLYPDKIVIKYPLGFNFKTDDVMELSTLEKVLFTRKTSKTRVVFTINGKKRDYEFQYDKVDEFIQHLNSLGVRTEKEGRSPYIF